MKKNSILMLMIAAVLLSACRKDDNDSPDENVYRLTKTTYEGEDIKGEYTMKYEDNKSVETSGFSIEKGVRKEFKTTFSYKENEVTSKEYTKEGDEWKQDGRELKSIVKDGLLVEEITKYIGHPEVSKTKYTYDGKKLIKQEDFSDGNVGETTEYKYLDSKVEVIMTSKYGSNKEVVIYKGDKIDKIEYYDYNEKEEKFEKNNDRETRYTYSGENISKIEEWGKLRDFQTGQYGEFQRLDYISYKYDDNGNLIEQIDVDLDDKQKEHKGIIKYEYEKGKVDFVVVYPLSQIYKRPRPN